MAQLPDPGNLVSSIRQHRAASSQQWLVSLLYLTIRDDPGMSPAPRAVPPGFPVAPAARASVLPPLPGRRGSERRDAGLRAAVAVGKWKGDVRPG